MVKLNNTGMGDNMKNLYEYDDRLNAPLVAFNYIASDNNFPILPHWHYFIEIIHMLDGKAEAACGNYVYTLYPGDTIIFFPQLVHSINKLYDNSRPKGPDKSKTAIKTYGKRYMMMQPKYNLEHNSITPVPEEKTLTIKDNIKYQVLKFNMGFLDTITNYKTKFLKISSLAYAKNPEYIYFPKEVLEGLPVYEIFDTCIKELAAKNYGYDIVACSNISILLSYFIRNWARRGLDIDEAIRTSYQQTGTFEEITEYIEKHYNEPLKISSLAGMCGMSYSNFAKLFKQTYNQSCKEYIEFIKINKVEDLLLMANIDLTYISNETGFADCSHLIRTFKKLKGITPMQWRNKNIKN